MTPYRIYVLNGDERVVASADLHYRSDAEALEYAEEAGAGHHAAEVWDGERLVDRLGAEFLIESSAA
jgi:hypothetical protein